MEPDILSSYATAEYLLVIEPHEALRNEISQLKKYFAETYDCPAAAIGKPNITLARFQQFEMIEQRIVHRLQLIATAHNSFMVELHDFGSFPAHSIFINVTTKTQIVELVKALRPMQHLLKIDKERKPHFITEPYITIARKLLPWQYEKGWLELSNTHFSGKFIATHLLLLRKRDGEKKFEMIRRFELLNVKESITQGQLFI
ncbi:MAG: 2'-5' RNA ligase family protein [Bacteroidota bacterium]